MTNVDVTVDAVRTSLGVFFQIDGQPFTFRPTAKPTESAAPTVVPTVAPVTMGVVYVTLLGGIDEMDAALLSSILAQIAAELWLSESLLSVTVMPSSVLLRVTLPAAAIWTLEQVSI